MMQLSTSKLVCEWVRWDNLPANAPIYMGEQYQSLLADYDKSEARLLLCRTGNKVAWLPLLLRNLDNGIYEAYSAYGYGGFLGDMIFTNDYLDALSAYLAESGVVGLFVRHSPFLGNQLAWPTFLRRLNRLTYSVDLSSEDSFQEYLARIPQKLRWSANYALRAGLKVEFECLKECSVEKILAFYRQYETLMAAKETSAYYLFSDSFFLEHARRLGNYCDLAYVTDSSGQLLSCAFFLLDPSGWVHYHLSASTLESMKLQGMELLMLSALHRYGRRGFKAMHLGGGHSLDEADGLSRFKSKFADHKLEFYCSSLICDVEAYNTERRRLPLSNPALFLISDARGTSFEGVGASSKIRS